MNRTDGDGVRGTLELEGRSPEVFYRAKPLLILDKIELARGWLVWKVGAGTWKEPGPSLLEDFLRLSGPDVSEEAILRFSRRWGILDICRHGEPVSHVRPARSRKSLVRR